MQCVSASFFSTEQFYMLLSFIQHIDPIAMISCVDLSCLLLLVFFLSIFYFFFRLRDNIVFFFSAALFILVVFYYISLFFLGINIDLILT